jgi:hypothetical protein
MTPRSNRANEPKVPVGGWGPIQGSWYSGELSSPSGGGSYLNRAMVIAMALMLTVETTIHEVVRVIAVGHRFMPAAWAVPVGGFVTAAGASRIAFRGIGGIHFQPVFVDMIAVHIVHVAIVKETLVPIVQESRVAALISVLMRVSLMNFVTHSGPPL